MEPIPETQAALDLFGPLDDGEDILEELERSAALVRAVVPTLVGLSLAAISHGVTLTVAATSTEIAALDGVQYLENGPCVDGAHEDEVLTYNHGNPLDEARWTSFARATAAAGVAGTLTLPITEGSRVIGSVNLYAAIPHAFDSHHEVIAGIFGAWAGGAVTDADLGFATRQTAQRAPQVLHDQVLVAQAVGLMASTRGISTDTAQDLITDAATRAGVDEVEVARRIIDVFTPEP